MEPFFSFSSKLLLLLSLSCGLGSLGEKTDKDVSKSDRSEIEQPGDLAENKFTDNKK